MCNGRDSNRIGACKDEEMDFEKKLEKVRGEMGALVMDHVKIADCLCSNFNK